MDMSQYSEKVMEHFRNPRNVGVIENPSGTGHVGNPVCVIGGTVVLCNNKRISIEDIAENTRVLSHDGRYHKVKDIFKRAYNGKMYKIFINKIGDITITPEHHILAIRSFKSKGKDETFADWFMASELKEGDSILFPISKEKEHKDYPKVLNKWNDDYYYATVDRIEQLDYNGEVYNLEVEDTRSYITECATLHNCGDIMELYIKVENDIITDAKFKTFGCGAAIATSSMVTELVKGKTVKEALEVSNKAVAEALGGLPPIKMHCSVLAESALKSAIEDYLKKSGKKLEDIKKTTK